MNLPDINLLIHAHHLASPHHLQEKDWWDKSLAGSEGIGLAWVTILGFVRISTDRGILDNPMAPEAACSRIDEWLSWAHVHIPVPAAGLERRPALQIISERSRATTAYSHVSMAAAPDPGPPTNYALKDRELADAKRGQNEAPYLPGPHRTTPTLHRRALVVLIALSTLAVTSWHVLPWMVPLPRTLSTAHPPAPRPLPITTRAVTSSAPTPELEPGQFTAVRYAELSPSLIAATVAAQDPGFWNHRGTDGMRVWRAIGDSVQHGRPTRSGSTITEQLAKLSAQRTTGRTIKSRLADALTARRIEMAWSKERILEEYLARLSYGNHHTGITAAAAGYFGKSPAELNLAESAFLAVLPDAPTRLDPYHHFDAAKQRQDNVLKQMLATGVVSATEAGQAILEPLKLRPLTSDQ